MGKKNVTASCLTNIDTCHDELERESANMERPDLYDIGRPIMKVGTACFLTAVLCLCPSLSFSQEQESTNETQPEDGWGEFSDQSEFSDVEETPFIVRRRGRNLDELRLSGDFSRLPLSDFFAYMRMKLSVNVRVDDGKDGHVILVSKRAFFTDYDTRFYKFTETFSRLLDSIEEEDLRDLAYSEALGEEHLMSIRIGGTGEDGMMVSAQGEVHRRLAGALTKLGVLRSPRPQPTKYASRREGELRELWNRPLPKEFILDDCRIDVALERLDKELEGRGIRVVYSFPGMERQEDGGDAPAEAAP
ncbi:MAG: hypothetical protein ACOCUY_02665 [Verrucomicrobiota bacterium]